MINKKRYTQLFEKLEGLEKRIINEIRDSRKNEVLKNISRQDVLPLFKYNEKLKKQVDKALENIIIPFPGFDPIEFDGDFDWTYEHHKNHVSYQLYLQSLRIVGQLLVAYEHTQKIEYLKKAKEITESWMSFVESGGETKMTWYDHPVGNRTQNLIHLVYLAQEAGIEIDEVRYNRILYKHAEYLMEDNNYRKNNHGIMVDRGLMMLGYVVNDDHLFNKGYYRVIDTFWHSFSYRGGHLENSPEYHNMVLRMYKNIEKYLNEHNDSLGEDVVKHMNEADRYLDIILKPNKRLPAVGDSGHTSLPSRKPLWQNFIDEEAGIAIIKNKGNKQVYLSFICGFSTITHKHFDDLSFSLNVDGIDFFVDAGKFDYSKSKIRKYVVTPKAHSSFQVENKFYQKKKDNKYTKKIWFEKFFDHNDFIIIKGRNDGFEGEVKLFRTIIFLKKYEQFIILDQGLSNSEKTYISNFNLQHQVSMSALERNRFKLTRNGQQIIVKNHTDNVSEILEGSTNPIKSLNATGPSKYNLSQQLQIKDTGLCSELIHSISLNEQEISTIKLENSYVVITIDSELIRVPI